MQQLRQSPRVQAINSFLRSPGYILALSLLTVVCNLLGLELVYYTLVIALGLYVITLSKDLLPIMPMIMLCYIVPSVKNNPGRHGDSIFSFSNGGAYILVLASVVVVFLIWRLISDKEMGRAFLTHKRSLVSGMLFLGVGYLLSGIGSYRYFDVFGRNLLFAFLQFISIALLYFLFTATVDWFNVPKDYLAWMGLGIGFTVLPQLLMAYLSGQAFMEGTGTMDRELIYTGWGMHNNIGGLMVMMIPFAYYLAYTKKHSWVYNLLGTMLLGGVMLSCSRTAMAVGAGIYLVCAVILLKNKRTRKENLWVYCIGALAVLGFVAVFFEKLMEIFSLFFEEIGLVSKRDVLLENGLKKFGNDPIFGGSFFFKGTPGEFVPWDFSEQATFSSFFPPRWHNTLVQIAASCGVVGLVGYGFHRFQTFRMLWKNRSTENLFIALYLAVLLLCSLMDCHFFNVGPVLFYSMALAFAENIHLSKL
jgi:hypothetical protein